MLALLKHAKNFVNKDEDRPLFNGIYLDGNRAIISNTHLLVIVNGIHAQKQIIHYKTCREIEGNYPDVDKIIPQKTAINFDIDNIHEWVKALKISLAVTNKSDYNICRLRSEKGNLFLETTTVETTAKTSLYTKVDDVNIAFNAKYLHDILMFFRDMEVETVHFGMNDRLKPIKLTTDKNVYAMLSPVRTD